MDDKSLIKKRALEYRSNEFWSINSETPGEKVVKLKQNPEACLWYHQKYFDDADGKQIANLRGSNGKISIPLALMGANITIFDISEENKRYALELAQNAGVTIHCEVCDFYNIDHYRYKEYFDTAYLEGGILHYFRDIDKFSYILYHIIKRDGKLILSNFHPMQKIIPSRQSGKNAEFITDNNFDSGVYNRNMPHKNYFPPEEQKKTTNNSLRFYTLSETLNAIINAGFILREFNEHPSWDDPRIPGEFTIYAEK